LRAESYSPDERSGGPDFRGRPTALIGMTSAPAASPGALARLAPLLLAGWPAGAATRGVAVSGLLEFGHAPEPTGCGDLSDADLA
jgi:hypothetical protein